MFLEISYRVKEVICMAKVLIIEDELCRAVHNSSNLRESIILCPDIFLNFSVSALGSLEYLG